ncbi:hypothetical protein, partial [Thiolapillus sp.]|uniref:hypothetical protein n=2 Tax=Thiolapillus sp. TaxID=2017437 RepID=UPI003AF5B04A
HASGALTGHACVPGSLVHLGRGTPIHLPVPPTYRLRLQGGCGHLIRRLPPQACLRPRDRFWDIPVPKIDSAFDNLLVPQPSWSPSTTQQLRKLVAAPYLAPI